MEKKIIKSIDDLKKLGEILPTQIVEHPGFTRALSKIGFDEYKKDKIFYLNVADNNENFSLTSDTSIEENDNGDLFYTKESYKFSLDEQSDLNLYRSDVVNFSIDNKYRQEHNLSEGTRYVNRMNFSLMKYDRDTGAEMYYRCVSGDQVFSNRIFDEDDRNKYIDFCFSMINEDNYLNNGYGLSSVANFALKDTIEAAYMFRTKEHLAIINSEFAEMDSNRSLRTTYREVCPLRGEDPKSMYHDHDMYYEKNGKLNELMFNESGLQYIESLDSTARREYFNEQAKLNNIEGYNNLYASMNNNNVRNK